MTLVDQKARTRISESLDETLFVEAGAGSGKTTALVDRIVNLVSRGTPVTQIAAITFTEAAARELRVRVRNALEAKGEEQNSKSLIDQSGLVESAAFTTLHGFALRLLSDHPVEAALPPGFGVVDEITSVLEFQTSWQDFVGSVGDDLELLDLQERAESLQVPLAKFLGVSKQFEDNWDQLHKVTQIEAKLSELRFDDLYERFEELSAMRELCISDEDLLYKSLVELEDEVSLFKTLRAVDQLQGLVKLAWPSRRRGRKDSWRSPGIEHVRAAIDTLRAEVSLRIGHYQQEVIDSLALLVAGFVQQRIDQRRSSGELAFHDLLVLARQLLRGNESVRFRLHQRYSHVLLDEFQDTDPIQIELAVLIASSVEVGTRHWQDLAGELDPGRLVVVGDPKQSIYRFRRADIGVYTSTQECLVDSAVELTSNFRSVPGIVNWVNAIFECVIGEGEAGNQPPYRQLDAARPDAKESKTNGPVLPVTLLGEPHPKTTKVGEIRAIEAAEVAAIICRVIEEGWKVEQNGTWRAARLSDIAVLIPSRLSLAALESAFDACKLPFRPETNSLVYSTQEVRDVLAGVRAVVEPTNSIDVVAALRSSLFAVGDKELLDWKLAGGNWDYRNAEIPESLGQDLDGSAIGDAFLVLRRWHENRWWTSPAELVDTIVRERRLREVALADSRPRDRWRRYRFLAEQAEHFTESSNGDLHDFVEWVEVQSSEVARVTEPVPAEADDDAVRVLTIHGSKGLEFPIVALAGAATNEVRGANGPKVLFPEEGRAQVKITKDRSTEGYEVQASLEQALDLSERVRLHYVGATRARDHLIVSAHHQEGRTSIGKRTWDASQTCQGLWQEFKANGDERYKSRQPTQLKLVGDQFESQLKEWTLAQEHILTEANAGRFWSATSLADAEVRMSNVSADSDSEKKTLGAWGETLLGDRDWSTKDWVSSQFSNTISDSWSDKNSDSGFEYRQFAEGSRGSKLGSAVHQVLQVLDFTDTSNIRQVVDNCCVANGVSDLQEEVQRRVELALESPAVKPLVDHGTEASSLAPTGENRIRYWRELYVAMPTPTSGIEGYIDLCFETDDGLCIVDYKTLAVRSAANAEERANQYRVQAASYALALEHVLGTHQVNSCKFVFIGADEATETELQDLDGAKEEVKLLLGLV